MAGHALHIDRQRVEYWVVAALVGVAAPNLIMFGSVPRVGAGFVSLTIAFPPLLTYVAALTMRVERFDVRRALGVGLALAGAVYMAWLKLALPDAPVAWIALSLLAPVILAVGNVYRTVRWPSGATSGELVPGVLVASSLMLVTSGVFTEIPLGVQWNDPEHMGLILLQTLILTAQYLLFFILQERGGPVFLSLLGSVAAVVGIPAAVLLLGETIPEGLLTGGIAIGCGIALVVLGGERIARPDRAPEPVGQTR